MNEDKKRELCGKMATLLPVLRKVMGATQVQFAELAGVTRSTIIRIEHNKTMSWNTYLSLLMVFSMKKDAVKMIRAYDLYPYELEQMVNGRIGA